MRQPRDYTGLRNPTANAPTAAQSTDQTKAPAEQPLPEPTRPNQVRAPDWPADPRMDVQGPAAQRAASWANEQVNKARAAQSAEQAPGKATIHADIEKARGNQPAQGQAREQAPKPESGQATGKAKLTADLKEAKENATSQQQTRDQSRSR